MCNYSEGVRRDGRIRGIALCVYILSRDVNLACEDVMDILKIHQEDYDDCIDVLDKLAPLGDRATSN